MNSAHSARVPASVMSPVIRTRSTGADKWMRGELAQRAANDPIAVRSLGAGLHAIAVALADDMQVGQMSHPDERRFKVRRPRHPVENRPLERKLAPDPIKAFDGSRETEDHRRIAERRGRQRPPLNMQDINQAKAEGNFDGGGENEPAAGEQQCRNYRADPAAAIQLLRRRRSAAKLFGSARAKPRAMQQRSAAPSCNEDARNSPTPKQKAAGQAKRRWPPKRSRRPARRSDCRRSSWACGRSAVRRRSRPRARSRSTTRERQKALKSRLAP